MIGKEAGRGNCDEERIEFATMGEDSPARRNVIASPRGADEETPLRPTNHERGLIAARGLSSRAGPLLAEEPFQQDQQELPAQ
ncbi:hypothetical protein GCM10014719_65840 [Planomonospora parontospora subsp. antibiotica]|nr:hypothetical protein GCM10014719_65840 [Planomonospora parontospora subsp. antibiotica]GII19810.1 hypothetical protein Ppa05_65360 [Planomonospora parontospora subsp. antibiotica]